METPRRITIRATERLHKAVRVKAAELGLHVSDIVRGLLRGWLRGDILLPAPEPEEVDTERD